MPAFTARMGLYLPGGGSLGIGGDDEVADIDRINQSLQRIDQVIGVPELPALPDNPFPGQTVTIAGSTYYYSVFGTWNQLTPHVGTTPPTNPQEGYLWVDTN